MDQSPPKTPPRIRWRRQWTDDKTEDELASSPELTQPTGEGSSTAWSSPTENASPPLSYSPPTYSPAEWSMIVLEVKVPGYENRIPIQMNMNNTVVSLKEKVLEQEKMSAFTVDRVCLQTHITSVELLDSQILKDCPVLDCVHPDNEIDVFIKPSPPTVVMAGGGESVKLIKVMVLPMNSEYKIEIEVNAEDYVEVLRKKLEEIHRRVRFRLPSGGNYYFIHKNNTLDELMSFQWNQVKNGDTIETYGFDDDEYAAGDDFMTEVDAFAQHSSFLHDYSLAEGADALLSMAIPEQSPKKMKLMVSVAKKNMQNLMNDMRAENIDEATSSSEPLERWVQVKSAGAISKLEYTAACGGVLLDRSGGFIAGYCKSLEECSVLRAELYGIFHGVRLALAKGFVHLEVVSVSDEAINLLSNGCMESHDEYQLVDLIGTLSAEQALSISWSRFTGEYSKRLEVCFAKHALSLQHEAKIFDVVLPQFAAHLHGSTGSRTPTIRRNLFS